MSASILTTVKKMVGLDETYTVFDTDIVIHINSVFFSLFQMGVGPSASFSIEDASATWNDFLVDGTPLLNPIKAYIALKVRMLFDPPTTSFAIGAINSQIAEFENRISIQREYTDYVPPVYVPDSDNEDLVIGGGTP